MATDRELISLPLHRAAELVRSRQISPRELTEATLAQIHAREPELRAFITVTAEAAMKEAASAEIEITAGRYCGPLHGIPIALKDLLDTAGVRTTAASGVFGCNEEDNRSGACLYDRVPKTDATLVRMLRDAGAVIVGKTNLHEFAYGGSGIIGHFGATRNPWDISRITGGSSSGSAAAVAAGMCFGAIGTDTAGSIRIPAAYCGIVGLKPTYGRVSAEGVIPLSTSLDHVGPMARTVKDAALMLSSIAEHSDLMNETAREDFVADIEHLPRGLRVGIPSSHFFDDLEDGVAEAIAKATKLLCGILGCEAPVEVAVPASADRTVRIYEPWQYHREYVARCPERYQPSTLERIRTGAAISDEAYREALRALQQTRESAASLFDSCDVIVTPASPSQPPRIDELANDPQLRPREIKILRNTRPFNELGVPAISLPCAIHANGLPIGLQIVAAPWREKLLLQVAHAFEAETKIAAHVPRL